MMEEMQNRSRYMISREIKDEIKIFVAKSRGKYATMKAFLEQAALEKMNRENQSQ